MNTHFHITKKLMSSMAASLMIIGFAAQGALAHGGGAPPPGPGPDPDRPHPHGWELQATIDSKACPNCNALYDELQKRDDWVQITVLDSSSWQCKLGGCNPPPENWLRHPRTQDNDEATQAVLRKYFDNVEEGHKWLNDQREAYENGMTASVITPKGHHHGSCLVLKLGKKVAIIVTDDAKGAAKLARTTATGLKDTAEAGANLVVAEAKSAEHLVAVHAKAAVKKVAGCASTLLGKLKNMLSN